MCRVVLVRLWSFLLRWSKLVWFLVNNKPSEKKNLMNFWTNICIAILTKHIGHKNPGLVFRIWICGCQRWCPKILRLQGTHATRANTSPYVYQMCFKNQSYQSPQLIFLKGLSQITFALRVGRWSEKHVVYYIKSAN